MNSKKRILILILIAIVFLTTITIFVTNYQKNPYKDTFDASIYLPRIVDLGDSNYITEIERGKHLKLVEVIEIDYNDEESIENELEKISNELAKNITKKEIQEHESVYKSLKDLREKDYSKGDTFRVTQLNTDDYELNYVDKMIGIWWTVDFGEKGIYKVFEKTNLQFVFRYTPELDFSIVGKYFQTYPRLTMRIDSQETIIFSGDYLERLEEIPTSNILIGAGRNFDNGKPKDFLKKDIEIKILVGKGDLDKLINVYARFNIQGVNDIDFSTGKNVKNLVKWSSNEGIQNFQYPNVSKKESLITRTEDINSFSKTRREIESRWSGITRSLDLAVDSVAVAAPSQGYLKLTGDYAMLEAHLSSTIKKDTRPIAAQFRYYISHPLSENFNQGYRTLTIEESYKIQ